ncbi:hypothetical protein C2S51_035699 [Perilla frutescens var. frutescens]|nr:hypothetical protein C2S51_035699 [Perilla frutescens var. frutescens]
MESEKETAGASNNQDGEKGPTEVKEKGSIKDDAGCVEPGKLEVIEGVEEAKQENEKAVENEEMKEGGENAGEEEEKEEGEKEEVEEGKSGGEEDDGEEREETGTEKKSVTLKSRKKRATETVELSSPRTPGSDRPTRERKTVERFTVNESARSSTPKPLAIEKGQGTQLKDIPNVAFKLSKRKADENLHLLHTILFGKKAKVHNLKKNIGLFSGFVWAENEGKQRAKVKEKLDKCVKEKMLDFCDVLNIPVNKATVKKEELLAKLLEFLESPHATSDMLLADKEKGKRRKSNAPAIKSPGSSNPAGGKYTKKQKLDSESGKKRKHSTEENDDKSEPSQSEDDQDDDNKVPQVETDDKENDSGEETGEEKDVPSTQVVETSSVNRSAKKKDTGRNVEKSARSKIPAEASNTPAKSTKKSSGSMSKKDAANSEAKSKQKAISTEKQKAEKKSEVGTSTPAKAKAASKSSTKVLKKDQGEGKSSKKAKKGPTREEMHSVVVNILKEVDFNTATLSDILRQLGDHFGLDLLHRKSEVKDIITEAIKNMSDDEDEEASESGDESGRDGGDDEA